MNNVEKKNIIDILRARGFIRQTVYEDDLYKLLGEKPVSFYIGYDPTADSLHVGHYLTLMAAGFMQRAGHKPIILIGGATAMVGDPSGRTDMRSMMTVETIKRNVECFKKQMSKFISFEGGNAATIVDNADWILGLNFMDFIREIGSEFSVNKMLAAECFKSRMEKGLTFLEFSYMLLQSYDFYTLFKERGCVLQCGGDDQWSNMLFGADLIRKKLSKDAYVMTFELLTTSDGKKMGKTMKGALWLDENKTPPYEFYQYWRNIEDASVGKCLKFLTFLELDKIEELTKYKDERINAAKKVLAYEITKLIHGEDAAIQAEKQAVAAFSGDAGDMPEAVVPKDAIRLTDILFAIGLAPSKGEARRLIEGGGIRVNDDKISDVNYEVTGDLRVAGFVLHKGKKAHVFVREG
ncbi:MAG: tyrosine--tRNA ligase [Clostridiales bacterium]|jgi:tyrosyl-tRNA synthetase|nr:tyrosine--tRNA ligase [Clostridiales bacterium]